MLLAITTTGKVVLILVAGSFIGFALVTSLVVPKRFPGFPGKQLPLFVTVSALLFAAQIGAVLWVTGTQEVESKAAEAPPTATTPPPPTTAPATTAPATTPPATTAPATTSAPATTAAPPTTSTATTTAAASEPGDAAAGKTVFGSAGCAGCHVLKDAGASGSVGPNLDDLKPPYALVIDRVTNGKGVMPSFKGQLSETQIQDVAKYVSSAAGT